MNFIIQNESGANINFFQAHLNHIFNNLSIHDD